jgi:hypothetical protein
MLDLIIAEPTEEDLIAVYETLEPNKLIRILIAAGGYRLGVPDSIVLKLMNSISGGSNA